MIDIDDEINAVCHQRSTDVMKKHVAVHFRGNLEKIKAESLHQYRKDVEEGNYAAVRYLETKFITEVNHT